MITDLLPTTVLRPLWLPTVQHQMVSVLLGTVGVTAQPDTSALPGGAELQKLMNGLDGWALTLSLVGLLIGAAAWALGSHGQNYQQSFVGRRAVLISGLAALLIGAGPAIVNFFFQAGQGVH
jgi:MFS family permease